MAVRLISGRDIKRFKIIEEDEWSLLHQPKCCEFYGEMIYNFKHISHKMIMRGKERLDLGDIVDCAKNIFGQDVFVTKPTIKIYYNFRDNPQRIRVTVQEEDYGRSAYDLFSICERCLDMPKLECRMQKAFGWSHAFTTVRPSDDIFLESANCRYHKMVTMPLNFAEKKCLPCQVKRWEFIHNLQ